MNKADRAREQVRLRKQKSRARLAAMDYRPLEDMFSASEREQMLAQAKVRGFDKVGEYLATLMRVDGERIEHDQANIGTCAGCNLPLPEGCSGAFKGQHDCRYLHGLPIVEVKKEKN